MPQQWPDASYKLGAGFELRELGVALQRCRYFFLQAFGQPMIKLILRALRNFDEADSRMTCSVKPGDFAFQLQRNVCLRESETEFHLCILRQFAENATRHA